MEAQDNKSTAKRAIANENERRRMKNINNGFERLRRLLPGNEKLSKAAILHQAADLIERVGSNGAQTATNIVSATTGAVVNIDKNNTAITTTTTNTTTTTTTNNNSRPISTSPIASSSSPNSASSPITTRNSSGVSRASNNNHKVTCTTGSATTLQANTTTTTTSIATSSTLNNAATDYTTKSSSNASASASSVGAGIVGSLSGPTATSSISTINLSDKTDGVAKAAIALPIDSPYYSQTAIRRGSHHLEQQLQQDEALKKIKLVEDEHGPKGQSLDTICKAILKIEGDGIFQT